MNSESAQQPSPRCASPWQPLLGMLLLSLSFFLIELLLFLMLKPENYTGLIFGAVWSLLLSGILICLPRKAARIAFGILYFLLLIWALAQAGYYHVFDKMMWLSTIAYSGEGAAFLGDVISVFPALWWFGLALMLTIGVLILRKFPKTTGSWLERLPYLLSVAASIVILCCLPEVVFLRDNKVWGTHSEYKQSSSYRATYNTMYDAKKVYDITGIYQLTLRDIWTHELYPLTPSYRRTLTQQKQQIDAYFEKRGEKQNNAMTGIFAGKNVVLVLMESMDDWMITPQDTPTLQQLMEEGINFTNFYTPGYGSARTLNSEFCMNTGIYLPSSGSYVFDYITNSFDQSIASQMNRNGYTSHVFHYNDPSFYSRDVFEPAIGYESYVYYGDYVEEEDRLFEETLLFDIPQIRDIFFRNGKTFNTIITRSAHLSYQYNEILSHFALQQYPQYRGLYASEEEDCARVKSKLVDDMFARLLQELETCGQLQDTVIIGMTDHYTYGYKNIEELYAHSGVSDDLLLEKTPCFIWSVDKPGIQVTKTLNTSDLLPTVLNLMGFETNYSYLGQDAFDPSYKGYALFPDGSWICDGVAYHNETVLMHETGRDVTQAEIDAMAALSQEYRTVSNLLLTCNYYR